MSLNDWLMITSIILLVVVTTYGIIMLKKLNKQLIQANKEVEQQIKVTKKIKF